MKPKLLLLPSLLLLISVISISCDDYVVHKINKTITDSFSKQDKKITQEFTSITIDFAKISIELPKYYFKTCVERKRELVFTLWGYRKVNTVKQIYL